MTTLLRAPRIVTAEVDLDQGWLLLDDDPAATVLAVGSGDAPSSDRVVEERGTVVPAFVDLHVHGALGTDFATGSVADVALAAAHHRSRGTGTLLASVATGTPADTLAAVRRLRTSVERGDVAGVHLEGPFLAPARRGAHAVDLLRAPDPAELDTLLEAGAGAVRVVTIAPELPGALDAVGRLARAGVLVAVGHTDADAETVRRALDAGATLVTHLFNGMPPLHHRHPGPVGVALTDDRATVELIVDGHHLDPVTVDLALRSAGDRVVLVSDAMAATGCADGRHSIAGSDVVVEHGVAVLADGSSLAGSTIAVADAVARLLTAGVPLAQVVAASSARAAALLGLPAPLTVGAPGRTVTLDPATGLPAGGACTDGVSSNGTVRSGAPVHAQRSDG